MLASHGNPLTFLSALAVALITMAALGACSDVAALYVERDEPGDTTAPGTQPPPPPNDNGDGEGGDNGDDVEICFLNPLPGFDGEGPSIAMFVDNIWPLLQSRCASCHGPDANTIGGLQVLPNSGDDCDWVRSYNSFYQQSAYDRLPADSPIMAAVQRRGSHASLLLSAIEADILVDALLTLHREFLFANGPARPSALRLDYAEFSRQIQPELDRSGCSSFRCHDAINGTYVGPRLAGFGVVEAPLWNSEEMYFNFIMAASFVDQSASTPSSTLLYEYASNNHAGYVYGDLQGLWTWIERALR